jgi:hypothetical protein
VHVAIKVKSGHKALREHKASPESEDQQARLVFRDFPVEQDQRDPPGHAAQSGQVVLMVEMENQAFWPLATD